MSIEFEKEKEKHICIGVGCARKKMFVISKMFFFVLYICSSASSYKSIRTK